jgi:hypothetical protein
MAKRPQKTNFSNDADIVIVDETMGVTDTTHRPLTGEALQRAKEFVARREELRRMAEDYAKKDGATRKSSRSEDEVADLK